MLYQNNNQHGGDIYSSRIDQDHSVSINPYGTSPAVIEAVRKAADQICNYPDPECRELICAIAGYENVPSFRILCGNGAAELIWSYCRAILKPGLRRLGHEETDFKAVVTAPSFSEYELGLVRAGAKICRYELKKEEGFLLEKRFIEFLQTEEPDAVFLCNPNNPDGRLIPQEIMTAILEQAEIQGFRLFVDECFMELSDSGRSLKEKLEDHPQVFLLKAFTKNYGMAGVRLGYCLSADEHLLAEMSRDVQPWNVSVIAQAAGIAALSDRTFPEQARKIIPAERTWLGKALSDLGLTVYPSEANFILAEGPEGLESKLREQGILIRNCDNFSGLGPGWYRIAVKLHEENERLVQILKSIL